MPNYISFVEESNIFLFQKKESFGHYEGFHLGTISFSGTFRVFQALFGRKSGTNWLKNRPSVGQCERQSLEKLLRASKLKNQKADQTRLSPGLFWRPKCSDFGFMRRLSSVVQIRQNYAAPTNYNTTRTKTTTTTTPTTNTRTIAITNRESSFFCHYDFYYVF